VISFCITCRNRLEYLKQTLPVSLSKVSLGVTFCLLDYGSSDGLGDWVKTEMGQFIEWDVLEYYRAEADHFDMAHAKNSCSKLSTGDVVCNLDADNFAEYEFQDYIEKQFRNRLVEIVCTDLNDGTHGRLSARRDAFDKLGGYDESFVGYGWDDNDFRERASRSGIQMVFAPRNLFREIPNPDKAGDYIQKNTSETNTANRRRSEENVRLGRYVANAGKDWGKITAVKNFTETVET
jgi:hypothetical protein